MSSRFGSMLLVLVFAHILIACAEESPSTDTAAMGIEVPGKIRQALAIDPNQLSAVLFVNGRPVPVQDNGTGVWNANVMVAANSIATVKVTWFENYSGVRLKLAEGTQQIQVGETGGSVILSDEYATNGDGFDNDGDGLSNLDERSRGSDPLQRDDTNENNSGQVNTQRPPRQLVNGNFEEPLGFLPGWSSCSNTDGLNSQYDPDTGSRFVRIDPGECVLQALTVTPGDTHSLTCDVAVTSTDRWSGISLSYYESTTGSLISESQPVTVVSIESYSRKTITGTAPDGATIVLAQFFTETGARIDNCTLETTNNSSQAKLQTYKSNSDSLVLSAATVSWQSDCIEQPDSSGASFLFMKKLNDTQYVSGTRYYPDVNCQGVPGDTEIQGRYEMSGNSTTTQSGISVYELYQSAEPNQSEFQIKWFSTGKTMLIAIDSAQGVVLDKSIPPLYRQ